MIAAEYVKALAIEAAAARLVVAARIAKRKRMEIGDSCDATLPGGDDYVLKIEHPGVLRLYDIETSVLWSESVVGVWGQPNPDFIPPRGA